MKKSTIFILVTVAVLVLITVFVAANNARSTLKVEIVDPTSGRVLLPNVQTRVTSVIEAENGWSRLELYVNNELVHQDEYSVNAGSIIQQPWLPTTEGPVMLEVRLYDRSGTRQANAKVAVLVGIPAVGSLTSTPGITTTPTLTATPQATPDNCTMAAALLQDVPVSGGSELKPGAGFNKTWRLQNSGTCDWKDYKLVYVKGSLLGGNSPTLIPEIKSGGTLDITLELTAPKFPGDYTGTWQIQSENGSLIGPELVYSIHIPGPTPTPTATNTATPTSTPTRTASPTSTSTNSPVPTNTPTPIPINTNTPLPPTPAPDTEVVINVYELAPAEKRSLSVTCDLTGGVVTSGGFTVPSGVIVSSSLQTVNGWEISASNQTNSIQPISVHAQCLIYPGAAITAETETKSVEPGEATSLVVSCSNGVLVGGGYQLSGDDALGLSGSRRRPIGWEITVTNNTRQEQELTAQATCLTFPPSVDTNLPTNDVKIPANQRRSLEVSCLAGLAVGGGFSSETGLSIEINRPTLKGWLVQAFNPTHTELSLDVQAICLSR